MPVEFDLPKPFYNPEGFTGLSSGRSTGSEKPKTYQNLLDDTRDDLITDGERLSYVLEAMADHLINGRGTISRPPYIVISPEGLNTLLEKLTQDSAKDRLARNKDRNSAVEDQVAFLVGGSLYTGLKIEKTRAYRAAQELLDHLFLVAAKKPEEEKVASPTNQAINTDLLDHGMLLSSYITETGAVADQLEDQFDLSVKGLIVIPENDERGLALPQALLETLKALKYPESAEVLEQWIYEKLSGDELHLCINYLRTLTQFTLFLDSQDYIQLYASGDEVSLLPFHSLYGAVDKASKYLAGKKGYENAVKELDKTRELILSRFHQILVGPLMNEVNLRSPKDLDPVVDELVLNFMEWAQIRMALGELSPEETARAAVRFLRQSGVENIPKFAGLLPTVQDDSNGETSETLSKLVVREAVRANALQDPTGETLKGLMHETYRQMEDRPWTDLGDCDLSELIPPDTEQVQLFYTPGTFGPWTDAGHGEFTRKIISYMDYMNEIEPLPKTSRLLVIAPIPSTRVPGYTKKFENVGTLTERVGSILIQNSDADPRVFITTKMQPPAAKAGTILKSINHFGSAFNAKLLRDMKSKERLADQDVQIVPCYGLDELTWREINEGHVLASDNQQNSKFQKAGKCLFVGRHGYLVRTIENAQEILALTRGSDFVLTPGTSSSSSEAIRQLQISQNTQNVLATALPYVLKHWGSNAIHQRKTGGVKEYDESSSVGKIYTRVLKEYKQILANMGVMV